MSLNIKAAGAALIVAGAMLGAGMLALPLVSAGMGYNASLVTLGVTWCLMTYTGLMLLEVFLAFPEGSGFNVVSLELLGKKGLWITNTTLMLLLYALTAAYIAGASTTYGSDIRQYFGVDVNPVVISAGFTLFVGGIVFFSTRAVDHANRLLFTLKIIVFILIAFSIHPYVKAHYLNTDRDSSRYLYAAFPVFITAFGFHGSIPSMIKYIGRDHPKTLRSIFVVGGLIPLAVYAIWEYCSLGVLPRVGPGSYQALSHNHGSVGMFLDYIHASTPNALIPSLFSSFTSITLCTSFLCVSLGLFDAMASSLRHGDSVPDRFKTALVTYLPPFVFAWLFPQGFIVALGAAAIFLSVLAILFPAAALRRLRMQPGYQPRWRVAGGPATLFVVSVIGVLVIAFQLLKMQNLLPMF